MTNRNEDQGLVFHIQKYSIQDGPGMRTTVFMKGCPLRCQWCHNPESVRPFPELMTHDVKCIACDKCVEACPANAITIEPETERKIIIDRQKCTLCFDCIGPCPTGALQKVGKYMTVAEVMAEIEQDEMFYRKSGGGVTVSGGEPLMQADFVRKLLQTCKERGIHTALDTCGYARWPVFESVLKYVDLVLYDIKNINQKPHKERTGVSNTLILNNLRRIPSRVKIWLRLPLIAGYNDSTEDIRKIFELAREVRAEKVSALPYHDWATGKYGNIGREYLQWDAKPPSDKHLEELLKLAESLGVKLTVGD